MELNPKVRTALIVGFIIAIGLFVVEAVLVLILIASYAFVGASSEFDPKNIVVIVAYFVVLVVAVGGCIALLHYGRRDNLQKARLAARVALVALLLDIILSIMMSGLDWTELLYLYQLGMVIFFQLSTDRYLARPEHFSNPFAPDIAAYKARQEKKVTRSAEEEGKRAQTEVEYTKQTGKELKGYIPLNFFNIFWIFVFCSILGLIIEVIWHALIFGGYQDRAGLLWGPLSPIYGFGAVLMTVALNRFWNRSKLVIFVVAGLIGAAFEFFVSYFMEYSFGIVAWDYSGTFLNIDGRTNFAFFCAWGLLGLIWIKLLLPDVLKVINVIPLKWHKSITIIATVLILFDGGMTLIALDCWYQRMANVPVTSSIQTFCAEYFNNDFMADRFQSMSIDPDRTTRIDQ